jgi:hypothetical protein
MLSIRLYQGAVLTAEVICNHETQRWIQNDIRETILIFSRYFGEGTEMKQENAWLLQSVQGQDKNRIPPECKS